MKKENLIKVLSLTKSRCVYVSYRKLINDAKNMQVFTREGKPTKKWITRDQVSVLFFTEP